MRNKIISYLGFAQKSGNAVIGMDNILKKRRAYNLILICNSASDRLKKEMSRFAEGKITLIAVDDLAELTNRNGCKAIGITEPNLASAIIEQFRGSV
ncbi:MAG: hypothetical protein PHE93_04885 [Clostridia bacterium]|nr:hypothetical protein [Clostridia bacterium]